MITQKYNLLQHFFDILNLKTLSCIAKTSKQFNNIRSIAFYEYPITDNLHSPTQIAPASKDIQYSLVPIYNWVNNLNQMRLAFLKSCLNLNDARRIYQRDYAYIIIYPSVYFQSIPRHKQQLKFIPIDTRAHQCVIRLFYANVNPPQIKVLLVRLCIYVTRCCLCNMETNDRYYIVIQV